MDRLILNFYRLLLVLACISMLTAFCAILLGIIARQAAWNIPGLDAYAGYAIAATLFLALPETFRHGDHIRVTLLLQKLPLRARTWLEYWCLAAGLGLSAYLAWFSCRLAWVSWATHDISSSSDATPLWIPQLAMALGSIGFFLSFADAWAARLGARNFFAAPADGELARVE